MRSDVAGYCPACGHKGLRLTVTNELQCPSVRCRRPAAASEILADREIHHIVEFADDGFTIRHPLSERLDGALMTCGLHDHVLGLDGPPVEPGRYRVLLVAGDWAYCPIAEGGAGSE